MCQNMFKCRNHLICIHVGDICDGSTDCPLSDDENVCSLNTAICPVLCECLTFAISCNNVTSIGLSISFPYHIIHVTNCAQVIATYILKHVNNVSVLSLRNNNFLEICKYLHLGFMTLKVDFGFNRITSLEPGCFGSCFNLTVIKLNNNMLSVIEKNIFTKLPNLSL